MAEKAYEKHAWMIFLLLGIASAIVAVTVFNPVTFHTCYACRPGTSDRPFIQSVTGEMWDELAASQPGIANYVVTTLRNGGLSLLGFAIFGIAIALTGFRRGEKWAWCVLWYFPVLLVGQALSNYYAVPYPVETAPVFVVGPFLIISLLGLLLPIRKFFPRRQS